MQPYPFNWCTDKNNMIKDIITRINSAFIDEAKNSPDLLTDMAAMEKYMSESYSGRIIVELLMLT